MRIVIIIAVLFLLICFLRKFMKYREKRNEIKAAAEDRMRDENLNHVILNSDAGSRGGKEVYMPYDVDYGSPNKSGRKKENQMDRFAGEDKRLMLQLIERTELATRKFVLNPAKRIRIGSDQEDNDISVLSEGISSHQCEIFAVGEKIYLRNTGEENRTILKRKKERAIVDDKGIRLLSGDSILLGNVSYDITIVD